MTHYEVVIRETNERFVWTINAKLGKTQARLVAKELNAMYASCGIQQYASIREEEGIND